MLPLTCKFGHNDMPDEVQVLCARDESRLNSFPRIHETDICKSNVL